MTLFYFDKRIIKMHYFLTPLSRDYFSGMLTKWFDMNINVINVNICLRIRFVCKNVQTAVISGLNSSVSI